MFYRASIISIILCFVLSVSCYSEDLKPVISKYKVHVYDELDISVWGVEGLAKIVSVRPDGNISFPLIGDFYALGKTPETIAEELASKLQAQVIDANVTVIVSKYYKPQVYVLGNIENSGSYDLTSPNMLLKILSQAKLLHPDISEHQVTIMRQGTQEVILLGATASERNSPEQYLLQDGDVIYVSYKENPLVFVIGNLAKPGAYSLPEDRTRITQVLAEANVLSDNLLGNGVSVIRDNEVMNVDLMSPDESFALNPNDVIFIEKYKTKLITIAGPVLSPGLYDFSKGQTVYDYISDAGGISETGIPNQVQIVRNYPDNPTKIQVNDLLASSETLPTIEPGDILIVQEKKKSASETLFKNILPIVRDLAIFVKLLDE